MINGISNTQASLIYESTQPKEKKVQSSKNISRVDEIKEAIKNGTYKVDIEKTAKAMAKSLL